MSTPSDQPVTLTYTVTDSTGALADAATVTIDVLNPDGTITSGSLAGGEITHASVGTYTYTTTPVNTSATVDTYLAHWTSTTPGSAGDASFKVTPKYHQPVNVTVSDLSTYLNTTVDATRGQQIIDLSVQLCESVVDPLPAGAEAVVLDVAERAYANPTAMRGQDFGLYTEGVGPFAGPSGSVAGGLWLTQENKRALRSLAGKGGAFSIDTAPAAAPSIPWWDTASVYGTGVSGDWDSPP